MRVPVLAALLAAGCVPPEEGMAPQRPLGSPWLGVQTRLLEDDLVNLRVSMSGKPAREALSAYADCAVAQYARIRGAGFARHIRTSYSDADGVHVADAVYTLSDALPQGVRVIDAEVALADCQERGIPTV